MDALIILLASLLPTNHVAVDHVDVIELHTLTQFDQQKQTFTPSFQQYIFWRFSDPINSWPGYHVIGFRLDKYVESRPVIVPGGYRMDWFDGKEKEQRRVVFARWYVVSECNWDPETSDRQFFEASARRELRAK